MTCAKPIEACAVDVETTRLDPGGDRIVTAGLARTRIDPTEAGAEVEAMEVIVNPGIPIPSEASSVHGICDQDVKALGPFEEVAQQVRDFIGNRALVGHNVSFDKAFLNAALKRAGLQTLHRNKSICTMQKMEELRGAFGAGYVRTNLENTRPGRCLAIASDSGLVREIRSGSRGIKQEKNRTRQGDNGNRRVSALFAPHVSRPSLFLQAREPSSALFLAQRRRVS